MGGGFPCAAFGGSRDMMERLAPVGPVYQAGTLSGNPAAVVAGITALTLARERSTGSRPCSACTSRPARSATSTMPRPRTTTGYARFFHHLLERAVHLPPSGYEMWTLSTAHGPEEIGSTIEAASSFAG